MLEPIAASRPTLTSHVADPPDTTLAALGWSPERARAFEPLAVTGFVPARVMTTGGAILAAGAAGPLQVVVQRRARRLAADGALPVVGDWLALEPLEPVRPAGAHGGGASKAALREILPRASTISRGEDPSGREGAHASRQVVAANVDVALLVSALTRDLNPRRIERYLLLAWSGGAQPIIVLNKADLCDDLPAAIAQVATVAGNVPAYPVSALTGEGLEGIRAHLGIGVTACLLGSSGVGKSTLTNALLGEARQQVRDVRADDSRGRHTTSGRELFALPGGGLLIDTPGLRSVGLWDDGDGLDRAFDDVAALAVACRFRDCRHQDEPGCAVLGAVEAGELLEERLASHRKLEAELHALALRSDARACRAQSRRLGRLYRSAALKAERRQRGEP